MPRTLTITNRLLSIRGRMEIVDASGLKVCDPDPDKRVVTQGAVNKLRCHPVLTAVP